MLCNRTHLVFTTRDIWAVEAEAEQKQKQRQRQRQTAAGRQAGTSGRVRSILARHVQLVPTRARPEPRAPASASTRAAAEASTLAVTAFNVGMLQANSFARTQDEKVEALAAHVKRWLSEGPSEHRGEAHEEPQAAEARREHRHQRLEQPPVAHPSVVYNPDP